MNKQFRNDIAVSSHSGTQVINTNVMMRRCSNSIGALASHVRR